MLSGYSEFPNNHFFSEFLFSIQKVAGRADGFAAEVMMKGIHGRGQTRADFTARPESNSDIETIYVFTRPDGLYVNYITVRYPSSTIMILR